MKQGTGDDIGKIRNLDVHFSDGENSWSLPINIKNMFMHRKFMS